MQLTDFTGLIGIAVSLVCLALRLLNGKKSAISLPFALSLSKGRSWFDKLTTNGFKRFLLGLFVLLVVLIPWGGLSLAEMLRGISGDLSISTLVLLLATQRAPLAARQLRLWLWLIVLAACVLYPFALGVGMFDSYRLGFYNPLFILAILALALYAWWQKFTVMVFALSLAVLAWSIGYYESTNLWDYLLDPWLALTALWLALRNLWTQR